jgi:hypothetical protein
MDGNEYILNFGDYYYYYWRISCFCCARMSSIWLDACWAGGRIAFSASMSRLKILNIVG